MLECAVVAAALAVTRQLILAEKLQWQLTVKFVVQRANLVVMQVLCVLEAVLKLHNYAGFQLRAMAVCAHKVAAVVLACVQQVQVYIVVSVRKAIVQPTEVQTVV